MDILGFWDYWNGCREKLTFEHAPQFLKLGIIVACHNIVEDEWRVLCTTSLTPKYVAHKLLTNYAGQPTAGEIGESKY